MVESETAFLFGFFVLARGEGGGEGGVSDGDDTGECRVGEGMGEDIATCGMVEDGVKELWEEGKNVDNEEDTVVTWAEVSGKIPNCCR